MEDPEVLNEEPAGFSKLSVLMVNAGEHPKMVEINSGLESLQQAVQGNIEVIYPFDDPVGIICNEEGKLNGMKLNRALHNDQGEIQDILAGPFLIVGLDDEDFRSLTTEEMEKYEGMFRQPETFVKMGRRIVAVPIPDEAVNAEKTSPPKGKENEREAI